MSGFDRQNPIFAPHCPPLNEHVITRRTFSAGVTALAGTLLLSTRGLLEIADRVDEGISSELWPDDAMRIEIAGSSEQLNQDGHVNLFFGGFGQKSVDTEGYFNTIGRQELTATMVYPNSRFTANDLADVTDAFLQKHNINTVNIIGPSMGMPIGIKTFGLIAERRNKLQIASGNTTPLKPVVMPAIDQLIGFSSPADTRDARKGELMSKIVTVARNIKQPPELVWMWLYSYVDGPGDFQRGVDIRNLKQMKRHFELSWYQVMNGTSPEMALSQMILLDEFNAKRDSAQLAPMIMPRKTTVLYTAPTNFDNTVDNSQAISAYDGIFAEYDVLMHVISTGDVGHANIEESILALQYFYKKHGMFNGRLL